MKIQALDAAVLAEIHGGQGYFQPPAFDAQSVWDNSKAIQQSLYAPRHVGSGNRNGIPVDQVPKGITPCRTGDVAVVTYDPPGQNGRLSCIDH